MKRGLKLVLAVVFTIALLSGTLVIRNLSSMTGRTHIVAYFDNSNGLFRGDEVRILGVPVGAIDKIEPQPDKVKITFWIDSGEKVPADAKAAILSPQLVTARAIQLTPAYTGGPTMSNGAVIPLSRTAVPVEWDNLRQQLVKLTEALQPTQPGGVSTLGSFIDTAAENLRGQGANIRETLIKLSQAFSILGDHSKDIFGTLKNLSLVVSALGDSTTLLRQLNTNLATVSALLADDPDQVGHAVRDLNEVITQATDFISDNKEALSTTSSKLASVTSAVRDSLADIKQSLHVMPNVFQNLLNLYQPTQAAITGTMSLSNFANPLSFLCGAIEAASRLGAEQSSKLCVQYLAPIIKNRQYNFPPLGMNLFVGESARPNEITYSEDRLRPDHVPTPPSPPPPAEDESAPKSAAAFDAVPTDPAAGLKGMMTPTGGGS